MSLRGGCFSRRSNLHFGRKISNLRAFRRLIGDCFAKKRFATTFASALSITCEWIQKQLTHIKSALQQGALDYRSQDGADNHYAVRLTVDSRLFALLNG